MSETASGSGQGTILALLILTFIALLALTGVLLYVLRLYFRNLRKPRIGHGENSLNKETQTKINARDMEIFRRRMDAIYMSSYVGKELAILDPPARWHQIHPKDWQDPWTPDKHGDRPCFIDKVN